MKKWLKYVALVLALLLASPVLFLLSLYGVYSHVVSKKPGALPVPVFAGPLGASVDPFIGTGGVYYMCANNNPAACVPFGLVRLAPDTASLLLNAEALNYSGYYYGDNKIIGFSHTRVVGAGVREGGSFRIFPTLDATATGAGEKPFVRFSHAEEAAFPGYYAVKLGKTDILAELTATAHTGIHRYTFPEGSVPFLRFDVTSALGNGRCEDGVFQLLPESREMEGSVRYFGSFSGRYDGLDLFFVARFSHPFKEYSTWVGETVRQGGNGAAGNAIGAHIGFGPVASGESLEVRLAISPVSIANARLNLDSETGGKSFDAVFADARDAWERRFKTIQVTGGTDRQRRIFYTALYRAFQMPSLFTDANGEYRGFDKQVHTADGFKYYTDFSLWDTFRTVHPLFNLVARSEQRDMMVSLVEMSKAGGGCLPRWPSGCGYTNSMFGTPADMTITEAWLKGIQDFDIETAYAAMRRTALEGVPAGCRFGGRDGLAEYLRLNYCPSDKMKKSVASTFEYAWADHSLSLLASALGKTEDARLFAHHATSYRNLWNPENRFFHPRNSAGVFADEIDPYKLTYTDFDGKYTSAYCEGSAMQWRWAAPFDPEGLVATIGDDGVFVSELEGYLEKNRKRLGNWHPGAYYWHGNEPYFHAAFLFNDAGRPDLTQKWVRRLQESKYNDDYVGLDGNDDCGTLSAWYVLSALGLYPVAGTSRYWISSPLFERAVVRMDAGITLTVIAENNPSENPYIQRLLLNDVPLDRFWLDHGEIAQGGILRFEMGPTPAKTTQ